MLAELTGEDLRSVMRHVPSPVTVVTLMGPDGPRGITIGSFTSVSLDPALISFNIMHDSSAHDMLLEADDFAVHILRDDQAALGERFAEPALSSSEQFEGIGYKLNESGIPILLDSLAVILCRPFKIVDAGDHSLFIGSVIEAGVASEGRPLLYYWHAYREVGETVRQSRSED